MKINPVLAGLIAGLLVVACEQQPEQMAEQPATQTIPAQPAPAVKPKAEASDRKPGDALPTIASASKPEPTSTQAASPYRETSWDDLVPVQYREAAVLDKYEGILAQLDDNDPKAIALYEKIQVELDNAPINEAMNGKKVRLAGFIAPLENNAGKVSEFLLVPYFGACIHVPPPPINQTVLVKTDEDSALSADDIYDPIWVSGEISTEGKSTDIGEAGYRISPARVEKYDE